MKSTDSRSERGIVDDVAQARRRRADEDRSHDDAQADELVAVEVHQRGQEGDHREEPDGRAGRDLQDHCADRGPRGAPIKGP